jgi:hypothetical protein
MWLYAEAWLPLLTIAIAAALCFGIASVFMGSMPEPPPMEGLVGRLRHKARDHGKTQGG